MKMSVRGAPPMPVEVTPHTDSSSAGASVSPALSQLAPLNWSTVPWATPGDVTAAVPTATNALFWPHTALSVGTSNPVSGWIDGTVIALHNPDVVSRFSAVGEPVPAATASPTATGKFASAHTLRSATVVPDGSEVHVPLAWCRITPLSPTAHTSVALPLTEYRFALTPEVIAVHDVPSK